MTKARNKFDYFIYVCYTIMPFYYVWPSRMSIRITRLNIANYIYSSISYFCFNLIIRCSVRVRFYYIWVSIFFSLCHFCYVFILYTLFRFGYFCWIFHFFHVSRFFFLSILLFQLLFLFLSFISFQFLSDTKRKLRNIFHEAWGIQKPNVLNTETIYVILGEINWATKWHQYFPGRSINYW